MVGVVEDDKDLKISLKLGMSIALKKIFPPQIITLLCS